MFGDFAAAQTFHAAVSVAHAHYVETLKRHDEILSRVGSQANHAAQAFTATESPNAQALRGMRCA